MVRAHQAVIALTAVSDSEMERLRPDTGVIDTGAIDDESTASDSIALRTATQYSLIANSVAALPKCEVLVDACVDMFDDGRNGKTEIAAAEAYVHLPWQEHSYGVQKHTFIGFEEVVQQPAKRVKTVPPRPVPDLQTIEEKTMIPTEHVDTDDEADFGCYTAAALPKCEVLVDACVDMVDDGRNGKTEIAAAEAYVYLPWQEHSYGVQKHTFIGFKEVVQPPAKRVKTVPPRPVPDLQTIEEKTMIPSNVAVPKSEIAQSGPKACEEVEEVVVSDDEIPKCWADEEETHWVTPANSHLDVVVPLVGEAHNVTMAPKVAEACDVECAIPTQPPHDADELPEGYQRTFNKSGVCALLWRIPKKKLKDTQMASQKFGLWFGKEHYTFMICGSPGGGRLQLNCQSEAPNKSICFRFLVGSQPPCVAVLNNFSEISAGKCATEWDFNSAVDKGFVSVTLEVMPSVRA